MSGLDSCWGMGPGTLEIAVFPRWRPVRSRRVDASNGVVIHWRIGGNVTTEQVVLNVQERVLRQIDGVSFDALDEAGVIARVVSELDAGRGGWIITPNVDILRQIRRPQFGGLLRDADLVLADGMPVVWASRLLGKSLPARVAGSSLIFTLSDAAAAAGYRIFLLGGLEGTAERAAARLESDGARVAGWHCPPFGFEHDQGQLAAISAALGEAAPDVVYVGLGFPKQENLIESLRKEFPATWFVGCGGSIAFAAGDVDRAPTKMQKIGLEWLHRLAMEPRRLGKRYLVDDIPYTVGLLARSAIGRRRNHSR
jgi:N-acetylglucosaminyldiphosphoundecaprenol N-acetyl-beta-D-mannosaminyltransferase